MTKTALAAALIDAGIAPADARLAEAADRALFAADGNFTHAMESLSAVVSADAALCWEAIKDYRQRVIGDLLRKAAERQNSARRKDALRTGGAQASQQPTGHARHPSDFNPGGAGQASGVNHGHIASAGREAGGRGQNNRGAQMHPASPPAGISAVARVAQRTLFDTLVIDGRPAGDITKFGYQDIARRKGAEAWFADGMARIMPPDKTLRESGIPEADVGALWNRATQLNGVEIRP